MVAALFHEIQCLLGEGPMWHAERNSLFWVAAKMVKWNADFL